MNTTTLTVRIRPEVAERLSRLAEATKRTRSFLAAEAIEEYVVLQEWQIQAIQQGMEDADRGEGEDLGEVRKRWEARFADSTDDIGDK